MFEFRIKLRLFFEEHRKTDFFDWLNDGSWIVRLAYLVDIREQHNILNIQMRGKSTNIIKCVDSYKAFKSKYYKIKKKNVI